MTLDDRVKAVNMLEKGPPTALEMIVCNNQGHVQAPMGRSSVGSHVRTGVFLPRLMLCCHCQTIGEH